MCANCGQRISPRGCCTIPKPCPCPNFHRETPVSDPIATLMLCKWLADRMSDWERQAKADMDMLAGERKAAVVDGQVIGHVTLTKGRKSARVADPQALLAYVKAQHPTEVETIEQVRPAYVRALLDDAVRKGAQVDSDGVVIDGLIEVVEGQPYPTRKLTVDADAVIAGLLSRGALGADGLKALETSDG